MSEIDDALARHAHVLNGTWESAGQFTQRVCYDLRAGYALIRKTGGTRCPGPGGGIDCDKLIDRVAPYRIYDIVVAAGSVNNRPTFAYTNHNGEPGVFVEPAPYDSVPVPPPIDPVDPVPAPPGLSPADVQAMIDASIASAMVNVAKYGELVGLQAATGTMKVLCHENGGGSADEQPFKLTTRSAVGPWESWTLRKGQL
jgi:hypothetical protein